MPFQKDPAKVDAAAQALDAALAEENPDFSWADALPEAPDLPTAPDETVAVFIPTKPVPPQQ